MVHDRCSTLLTGFSTALTTILPILFQYCYECCYIWYNPPFLWKCLYQVRVITVFPVFRLLTDFVCLYTYEFWLSLSTNIYDKRDDFNFKIIYFPNMCSNIPASPAYGAYISQLISYARASSNYYDFLKRHLHLRNRLLDQGYEKIRLIRSLKKFIFRYQDLVEIYSVSAETIINDAFSYSENV